MRDFKCGMKDGLPIALGYVSVSFTFGLIAVVLSCCFKWIPVLNQLSSGFVIIICAVAASAIGAFFYPVLDEEGKEIEK